MKRTGFLLMVVLILAIAISFSGCAQNQPAKLPAIEVEFSHYNVNGTHLLKIKKVDDVLINRSEAPKKLYKEPPFPGIHLFAYNGLDRTLITYVPIEKEGDNLIAYVGFENPDKVPKENDTVLVYMDVVDRTGKILASHSRQITWELETESLNLD